KILNKKPTYNEFIVKCPNINGLIRECKKLNILPPLQVSTYYPELSDVVLVCVTELNSNISIEKFIKAAKLAIKVDEEGSN
ncbi:MAG: hypothetical protein KGD74_10010, partial [Candidatus Lokiarchaeota archaeon]|nr:hypothetical protein [Candidatus Lokiarchaeota archaeon]